MACHSQQSKVWTDVLWVIERTYPTIFDSFASLDDALSHLSACIQPPVSSDYVRLIARYYEKHPDSFQKHINQIYAAMEKLVTDDKLKER